MFKTIDFTKLGGLHTYQQTWNWLQTAYASLFDGLAIGMGDKVIIHGVQDTGAAYTEGLIVVNGELLPFTGGPTLAYVTVEEIITQEQFDDGALKDTYTIKRAKFASIPSVNSFPFTDLKRKPFTGGLFDNISSLQKMVQSIIGFEAEVVLNGCITSAINTVASTMDISAGLVLFGESLVNAPAYSGAYPVYLTSGGAYTTVLPGAGAYVTFSPYTSQRYKDVLKRAITSFGEIKMFETLSDRFDVAGIGRWEMKGFKLVSALQNRVPVGLWFDGVAVSNVSDFSNTIPGGQYGEKSHTLQPNEQGTIKFRGRSDDGDSDTASYKSITHFEINGETIQVDGLGANTWSAYKTVRLANDADPHENRQPSTVIVYAKRED